MNLIKVSNTETSSAHKGALANKQIAISISESNDISDPTIQASMDKLANELSLELLKAGATLVYGGHLGSKGYVQKLSQYLRYTQSSQKKVLQNYVAWPLSLELNAPPELVECIDIIKLPKPEYLDNIEIPFSDEDGTLYKRLEWAVGLTDMRIAQSKNIDARIVIGGNIGPIEFLKNDKPKKITEYAGTMPGVLEEVMISLDNQTPTFLIGSFGGMTQVITDTMKHKERPELDWAFQSKVPTANELAEIYKYNDRSFPDYSAIRETLSNNPPPYLYTLSVSKHQLSASDATAIFNEIIHNINQ